MAKVLNIKDCGYKVPNGAVYVGCAMPRYKLPASKWSNPYKVGDWGVVPHMGRIDHKEAVRLFKEWLGTRPDLIEDAKRELKGVDLVCWDAPLPCHADVLLKLANE